MVGWDAEVGWLGVVITPGGEIIVALAGAAVDLDLDTTHLHHRQLSAHCTPLGKLESNPIWNKS